MRAPKGRDFWIQHGAREMDRQSLEWIVYGAALLGSGGGGKISSGEIFLQEVLNSGEKVLLLEYSNWQQVPLDEVCGCVVCDIGSITAFDPQQSTALEVAINALAAYFDKCNPFEVVFPIETGPENIMAPFVLASRIKNMVVMDGDGAGRAIPILPLSTFSVNGMSNWKPIAISNGRGEHMLVSVTASSAVEALLRPMTALDTFASSASLALWPEMANSLMQKCIPGTISRALRCGELLEGIQTSNWYQIHNARHFVNQLQGALLVFGEVIFKETEEKGAFNYTKTRIKDNDRIVTIVSQNESLIAFSDVDDQPIAVAPDSICYLDHHFRPLTNAEIKVTDSFRKEWRQRIFVCCIKADGKLTQPIILSGFDRVLQELGFNNVVGLPSKINFEPLGNLLVDVARKEGILH